MIPAPPWQILHLDLQALPERLALRPDVHGAVLYFRFDGLVLGTEREVADAFPLYRGEIERRAALAVGEVVAGLLATGGVPASDTEILSAWEARTLPSADTMGHLADLAARWRSRPANLTASLVICTCRRPAELSGCLESLSAEIATGRETIVVDNGPDPDTEAVVRAWPGVRYVTAPRPGLSHARNVGLAAAQGDVVVFVDDDVRPEPGWIAPLLAAFRDDVVVVCGLVLPARLDTLAEIAFQDELGFGGMGLIPLRFDRSFLDRAPGSPPVWTIGAGANMAVRRDRALALGGFDERIGPGAAGGCGDDSEFWRRVLEAGDCCAYQPFSVVRHCHRSSLEALRRQARGYGLGHAVALFAQYGRHRDIRDLRRALLGLPAWLLMRSLKAPVRALAGRPDRLLWSWWRGYLRAFRHVGLAAGAPQAMGKAGTEPGPDV